MSEPIDIPSLTVGSRVEGTFLVLGVEVRTPQSGDPFTVITLGNTTGRIGTEPFWSERQQEIAGLQAGHVVQVAGDVQTYRDRRQLRITSVTHVPKDAVDLHTLLPSVGSVDRYWSTLDGWRREITKPRLRAVLDLFYEEDAFRQRYEQCPAAVFGHHAQLGGLLKHTTEVAAIARTIARACGADVDLVLAGVLLHDIGKLEAYKWDGPFETTHVGRLLGHIALGVLMFDRRLDEEAEPPCTDFERNLLLHLILSHHGRLEWGAPVTPMTLEAEVLHWADNASAKTAGISDILKNDEHFPDGLVSNSQRMLEYRRLFRGQSDWGLGDAGSS
jgi:3'-5' exoribonuclease